MPELQLKDYRRAVLLAVENVAHEGAKTARVFLSPTYVVKATYFGKRHANGRQKQLMITLGKPNYLERAFIKDAKKAGCKFPIRKPLLKWAAR